jgi:hypothetical protein
LPDSAHRCSRARNLVRSHRSRSNVNGIEPTALCRVYCEMTMEEVLVILREVVLINGIFSG